MAVKHNKLPHIRKFLLLTIITRTAFCCTLIEINETRAKQTLNISI